MDELEKYYQYLKSKGADVPDTYQSFRNTLSDENSAKQYYAYLQKNKFDVAPTFDSFQNTFDLKKKMVAAFLRLLYKNLRKIKKKLHLRRILM